MRKSLSAGIVLVGLVAPWPGSAAEPADPLALYGPFATYDILRNGEIVGEHRIDFDRRDDQLWVESRSDIEVPFLFMTAYDFTYRATSVWDGGKLLKLEAVTDDDGSRTEIVAERQAGDLLITGPDGRNLTDPLFSVSEHWSESFIETNRQLNTITGEVNRISVTPLPTAFIPTSTGIAQANRYRLSGDLSLETWYDDDGRWLGMRFAARDNSTIEYRCRTCAADVAKRP